MSFSDCTSSEFELQAYDVAGGMAYTAGLERTTASIDGERRSYSLRATTLGNEYPLGGKELPRERNVESVVPTRCTTDGIANDRCRDHRVRVAEEDRPP